SEIMGAHYRRCILGDRLYSEAKPNRILELKHGPLIAVRLWVVTRKTLGGIQTYLEGRALGMNGKPIHGLFAAGEAAGFGGGCAHGYNALEGTLLGGCIVTGRTVGGTL